nr:energy coupling factor transporter S component ThiW [uncultured Selenomonas sp.]
MTPTRKRTYAGILTAIAVLGSVLSFPVLGSRCAPVQHLVNILAAVLLGPFWGIGVAFAASLLRNITGLGSLMAFPGSMIGALCCGIVYHCTRRIGITCLAEALGTGILGALAAYPVAAVLMGLNPTSYTVYILPFLISTGVGSAAAFLLLRFLLPQMGWRQ